MTIHLDVSQLVADPRRSGIQRVERELIRHWPGPAPLRPCRFDPATRQMQALPEAVLSVLCGDATPGGIADDLDRLTRHLGPGPAVPRSGMRLLNLELFLDPDRAEYYRALAPDGVAAWLVYDFLPALHPQWFGHGVPRSVMPYMRAMLAVPRLAFISHRTRSDFASRIARRPVDGPVIPMGGDGLDLERQRFRRERRDFVLLGTIEPRKNVVPALRAFQRLWAEGATARLTVIGAMTPAAMEEHALLRQLAGHPGFRHLQGAADAEVRVALSEARALLFPSEGEGFGIPPMEALHAGLPVIVSAGLPALDGMPGLGQIRLDSADSASIAAAVRRLLDDGEAARLWDEAAAIVVPGWPDFARRLAAWVQEG